MRGAIRHVVRVCSVMAGPLRREYVQVGRCSVARSAAGFGLGSRMLSQGRPAPPPSKNGDGIVFYVDEASFTSKVMKSNVPVIVYATASWCGPCKKLTPLMEAEVRAQKGKVIMAKVDVDESKELAGALNVRSVPTVMAVSGGKLLDQFLGAQPDNVVKEFVKRAAAASKGKAAPSDEESMDPVEQGEALLSQALQAMSGGEKVDTAVLADVFKQVAGLEAPKSADGSPAAPALVTKAATLRARAFAGLVRLALNAGALEDASSLGDILSQQYKAQASHPEVSSALASLKLALQGKEGDQASGSADKPVEQMNGEELLQLATSLAAKGKPEEAVPQALAALKKDPKLKDRARDLLLELFKVLGPAHQVTIKARKRLSALIL